MPWLTASGLALLAGEDIVCRRKQNGNARRAVAWSKNNFRGAMSRRSIWRIIPRDGRTGRSRWGKRNETRTGFAILERTCTSGARIGLRRNITARRRSAILRERLRAGGAVRAEGRGGIRLRFRVARRGRVFRRSFSTRIMDFAWRGI